MDGLFSLVKMLFGIDVEPADGLAPVSYLITFHFTIREDGMGIQHDSFLCFGECVGLEC